jgi:hypothetical protein
MSALIKSSGAKMPRSFQTPTQRRTGLLSQRSADVVFCTPALQAGETAAGLIGDWQGRGQG